RAGDVDKLATVPGIGKKSAARIALELKDKVERMSPAAAAAPESQAPHDRLHDDALSALVNLGYKPAEVKETLKRLGGSSTERSLQELIREVLKELANG